MERTFAIVEREMRRFRRSPMLIVMSLIMPIVQLLVLGYAFGGTVKNLKLGVVDQDRGMPAVRMRELAGAVSSNAKTFVPVQYSDLGQAVTALRNGELNGVLSIPPDFSRRVLSKNDPHVAIIEDNTDGFVAGTMAATASGMIVAYDMPEATTRRVPESTTLDVVEVYPYVPYIQYLLSGSIVMSIFMMVMIGGGIIFIDDKSRGLHEGYLVTPITKLELVLGFTISGAIKAVIAAVVVVTVGSVIAGVPNAFEPIRLMRLFVVVVVTSMALVSMMFLLMVRMNDPLLPRALFGVLNTFLYFPSGAVYPQQAFPGWMKVIAVIDPFTYAVHALKCLTLKNTGFGAIGYDLLYLSIFTVVCMSAATWLFRRTL
jgi:ABC-2 type transport system permease protein